MFVSVTFYQRYTNHGRDLVTWHYYVLHGLDAAILWFRDVRSSSYRCQCLVKVVLLNNTIIFLANDTTTSVILIIFYLRDHMCLSSFVRNGYACLSVCPSVRPSVCWFVRPSVRLPVCLSVFLFNCDSGWLYWYF